MYTVLLVIHTIIVLFLIVMVLLQRTDSDGLGGLSGGGNQFLTGRSAANIMTRTTAFLAGAFMLTSLVLAVMASRMTEHSIIDTVPHEAPVSKDAAPAASETAPAEKTETPSPAVPKPE